MPLRDVLIYLFDADRVPVTIELGSGQWKNGPDGHAGAAAPIEGLLDCGALA
jgi:hypothetical protein